ncbi:hypothetical protein PVAND_017430 [Polypedilum vanderplanki]|uniref:ISXO2-like transposase domain-containing protein n=1 Tax=Polypedilum vanderplanki TaxID=319348 RepID=A0A9J6BJ09_POLVA|nr:hypothetical protein PVAND_017430 [Polypedilum vanderplanki]
MFKCMQIHSRLYHSSEDGKNEFDERNFCKLLELNSIENGVGLIRLLQNTGAIPEAMRCKKCKNFMKIRKNGNFYKWCCNMIVKGNKKAPRRCNYSQSLTSSTFFSGSHLSILQVCMFTELWIQNIPLVFIKEEVEITQKTAIYWSSFCREVCFDALIEKTQTSVGGEEKVVEIYESIFGHRKYNHRKRIEGQWVFGILERDTGNTILVPVDNRDHDTLFPIIQDYILPGTTIISDYWKSYDCLNSEEYTYLKVNHNVQFKDPVKGANTNKIESIWRAAKSKSDCLSSGRRKKFFAGYMAKYMFLKKCRIQNLDPFIEFMKCAGQLYDGVPHTLETNESNEDESDEEESFLM